jgi:dTDP-4-dehydrorhamnose reductase
MNEKILVTGASGFLGWNFCSLAKFKWDIYGTYFSRTVELPGVKLIKVNLTYFQTLKQVFFKIQPTAVIHFAALSSPNYCQNYPDESYLVNVTTSINIASLCADYNIPLVFTSTDLVFDGLNPPYSETDPVSPINYYGEHKAIAEQKILELYPNSAICRMPLMFGAAPPKASSFIQPFIKTLKEGKDLYLFTDEFRTPVSALTAVAGLLLALERVNGLIHLGGKERISRYDFGHLMAEILELPKANLKPCLQQKVKMSAPRPLDTSLDSSKAFALGYQPLSLREQLQQMSDGNS